MYAFILDGTIHSNKDLALRISEVPILPTSEKVIESIEIDGREGSLTIEKGWKDMEFSFKSVLQATNYLTKWREIVPKIVTAKTITFTNDATVHYKIKQVKTSGLKQILSNLWEFEIEMVCAPFRYMNDVAILIRTSSGTVASHGNIYSLPRIKVFGVGKRTLTINGKAIVLDLQSEYLVIDSELKECFYGNVATNHLMTGDFPVFNIGNNQVTLGTGITKVEIEPRWRYL